ncbi:MAG: hypothetical protein WA982_03075 [Rubrobacteraceae bacterium]
MDLKELYGGAFVNWETVAGSCKKRTVSSRLMLFSARRYLQASEAGPDPHRAALAEPTALPDEVKSAFATPPEPESEAAETWGKFVDAALSAELEMISYGERPPILQELRAGLEAAAGEAGNESELGRWFLDRHDALPGGDLPKNSGYLPV